MREIKFRAWDKKNKRMWNIRMIDFFSSIVQLEQREGDHKPSNNCLRHGGGCYSPFYYLNDLELMQFTNLHDKNGKEINEGDIVEFPMGITIRREIIFCEGIFRPKDISDKFWWIDCKVIGNIYENPELLEKT